MRKAADGFLLSAPLAPSAHFFEVCPGSGISGPWQGFHGGVEFTDASGVCFVKGRCQTSAVIPRRNPRPRSPH